MKRLMRWLIVNVDLVDILIPVLAGVLWVAWNTTTDLRHRIEELELERLERAWGQGSMVADCPEPPATSTPTVGQVVTLNANSIPVTAPGTELITIATHRELDAIWDSHLGGRATPPAP